MIARFFDLKILSFLVVILSVGCQKLKPEQVSIPEYPDLKVFFDDQVQKLNGQSLLKEVSLEGETERKTFEMDTTRWEKELSFFSEINPNQPEYVGAFSISGNENQSTFNLKEGEKGVLKTLMISSDDGIYTSISATVHEEKDVYTHHREIEIKLSEGFIESYRIDGYQKMMLKDTVRFMIKGVVSDK